jgi:hypothetical protein
MVGATHRRRQLTARSPFCESTGGEPGGRARLTANHRPVVSAPTSVFLRRRGRRARGSRWSLPAGLVLDRELVAFENSDCEHLAAHPVNRHDPAAHPRSELAWRGVGKPCHASAPRSDASRRSCHRERRQCHRYGSRADLTVDLVLALRRLRVSPDRPDAEGQRGGQSIARWIPEVSM